MSRPADCANSSARRERTPAAQDSTSRLPGSFGRSAGSNCESGRETEPGIWPAANSYGSRTSTSRIEPSLRPALMSSMSRSFTIMGSSFAQTRRTAQIRRRDGHGQREALRETEQMKTAAGPARGCADAKSSSLRRDAQDPAGLDQVGVLHRRRVGLDDL